MHKSVSLHALEDALEDVESLNSRGGSWCGK